MADYSHYGGIAPDWARLVAETPLPPPPPTPPTPVELRDAANAAREEASRVVIKDIQGVSSTDYTIPTTPGASLPVRVYRPSTPSTTPLPIYVWFHGGGFLFGSLDGEDAHCFRVVAAAGVLVVHVCYRHTPEWGWPAAADDAWAGLEWVFAHAGELGGDGERVVVAGRSAGGLLAAEVAIREREVYGTARLAGQILDIPLLCHSTLFPTHLIAPGKSSLEENADAPVLPLSLLREFEDLLRLPDPSVRSFNPLLEPDDALRGVARAHFHIAGRDPLRDGGLLYAEKLRRVGVPTTVDVYPGVPHGFRRFEGLEASRRWDEDHVRAVREMVGF